MCWRAALLARRVEENGVRIVTFACRLAELIVCETLEIGGATGIPAFGDAVTSCAPGKKLHREDCNAGPEEDPSPADSIEQRCLPARRQQAGNPASGSEANADGGISEKLKRPNKATASARRTTAWYIRSRRVVKTSLSPSFVLCGD